MGLSLGMGTDNQTCALCVSVTCLSIVSLLVIVIFFTQNLEVGVRSFFSGDLAGIKNSSQSKGVGF